MSHQLSKSTFLKGCQCHKALYLQKHHRDLQDPIDEAQQAVFDQGTQIGQLAQQLFPGGQDASPESHYNYRPSIKKTAQWINSGEKVIYEAAFLFNQVLCAMDILVHHDGGFHAYEVKGSTSVKEVNILDAALQYYVITQSGIELEDISIVVLNNAYKRQEDLDINQLFKVVSVKSEVLELQNEVTRKVAELKAVLNQSLIPERDIGPHCFEPYGCNFLGHCWKHIPSYSVFDLTRGGAKSWDLYHRGIFKTKDIPEHYPLSTSQRIQIDADKTGTDSINKKEIQEFLNGIKYPISFLDFETVMPTVPLFKSSRPYQQLTFQYSLHIQVDKNSDLGHGEFLAKPADGDPRIPFMESLVRDIPSEGSILAYNSPFEARILREIAEDFPEYAQGITLMIDRMIDLAVPFRQKHYYTREMHGRYSIKKVLPALVPGDSYDTLEIQDGGTASRNFLAMLTGNFVGDELQVRKKLLEYCGKDTMAMVKILEKLNMNEFG